MNEMAPAEEVGAWSGLSQGAQGFLSCISTFFIALVYDENNKGGTIEGRQGRVAMFITAGVSTVAVFCYVPLIFWMPKKVDKKAQAKQFRTTEEYDKLTDQEWKQLTLEEIEFHEMAKMEAHMQDPDKNSTPYEGRSAKWGRYSDDLGLIDGMLERAPADLGHMRKSVISSLTNVDEMLMFRKNLIAEQKANLESPEYKSSRENAEREMGKWIADYFTDAGYGDFDKYPHVFKVMLLNAFPAIDKLDGKAPDWEKADIEAVTMSWLQVVDGHVNLSNAHLGIRGRLKLGRNFLTHGR